MTEKELLTLAAAQVATTLLTNSPHLSPGELAELAVQFARAIAEAASRPQPD
jgi:hypothetical protein